MTGAARYLPAGAGLAAAAGLVWLLTPGFRAPKPPEPAPAVPSAEPALSMPKASPAPKARAEEVLIKAAPPIREGEGSAPAMNSVAPAGLAAAALAFAVPPVEWKWPAQLTRAFARGLSGGSASGPVPLAVLAQTILSWNAGGPVGRRAVYHQLMSDGTERVRGESELQVPPLPRQQEPLVFDLPGTGIKTSARKVIYGITGTKADDKLMWINEVEEGMGILVFDADKNGVSGKTGLELFGDQTDLNGDGKADGFPDGYSALRAFVDRAAADGILAKGARARGLLDAADLAALERAYGLKMKVGGFNRAPISLAEAGVRELAFSEAPAEPKREFDGRGNGLSLQQGAGFTRRDGTRGIYADVWLTAK